MLALLTTLILICAARSGELTSDPQSEAEECDWEAAGAVEMPAAVVLGATGAVGTELWRQLAASGRW